MVNLRLMTGLYLGIRNSSYHECTSIIVLSGFDTLVHLLFANLLHAE